MITSTVKQVFRHAARLRSYAVCADALADSGPGLRVSWSGLFFARSTAEFLYMQVVSGLLFVIAFSFRWLRVADEGLHLALRYGPLAVFRRRIAFDDIAAAEQSRSSFIDGWGIHWVPGRGWTFNLWGFDCVLVTLKDGRTVRIGTDDPDGLSRFLRQRLCDSR